MPVPSRFKSIGSLAGNDASKGHLDGFSLGNHSDFSSTSHLANLRSMSRGNLLKTSSEQQAKQANSEARSLSCSITMKQSVSHDSVELLSTRSAHPSAQRRQTLSAIPKRLMHIEEQEGAANMDDSFSKGSLLLPAAENPILSPQIVGGLQYKTSTSCRRQYKPRYSIDNADVSSYRGPKKLALEPMQEGGREGQADRIRVYVRLRPMSSKEKDTGARCCVRAANKRDIYLTEMALESDYLRLKRLKGRYFVFDGTFPDDAGQEEIYRASTAQLVEGVLEGRNSSVFCYGATGAGKTFTMLGTVRDPGVMVLALKDLFTKLKQRSRDGEHSVRLSYLEVYNETVRDLLSPGRALVLREDAKQGIVAAGLTQYKAFSADEVIALLQQGNQNRTTEPTRLNETSSRSHAILQVIVEYSTHVDSRLVSRIGKLSLIDLAGSERAIATDQCTLRSLEGAKINRSLLALSSCISALVEGKKHIPFRNSKLTQLLKDSLGGSCQTAMIANISPSNLSFGETQNTLYWADRAKEIRTKGCFANEELQVPGSESEQLQLLLQVQKDNQQLRRQVAQLQQKLLTLENTTLASAPAAVQQGSAVVMTSSAATPLKRSVQKENIERTGVKHKVGCEDILMRTPISLSSIKRKISTRSPLPPSRGPSLNFHSTSSDYFCRKRTFWDITNINSPSKSSCRNTKRNTAAETPSMLLQPGFLRGRPSFN